MPHNENNDIREVSVLVLHDESCKEMLEGFPWDPTTR